MPARYVLNVAIGKVQPRFPWEHPDHRFPNR